FLNKAYYPIGVGAWLGTFMLINVWWLIWPNQKKILGIVSANDEEKNKARRVAFLASRTNTMFSIPLLYFMAAGAHSAAYFGYERFRPKAGWHAPAPLSRASASAWRRPTSGRGCSSRAWPLSPRSKPPTLLARPPRHA